MSLLIVYVVVLSINERRVLKSLTLVYKTVYFLLSTFFMCFEALLFGAYTFMIVVFSYETSLFIAGTIFCLENDFAAY